MSKTVKVSYFALFREKRGVSSEECATEANTLADFYEELKEKYGFALSINTLRVARNSEFCPWEAVLKSGDEIVFIPPVAGG